MLVLEPFTKFSVKSRIQIRTTKRWTSNNNKHYHSFSKLDFESYGSTQLMAVIFANKRSKFIAWMELATFYINLKSFSSIVSMPLKLETTLKQNSRTNIKSTSLPSERKYLNYKLFLSSCRIAITFYDNKFLTFPTTF